MNLEQLPIIGRTISKWRANNVQRVLDSIPPVEFSEQGKKSLDVLGGVLDMSNSLSSETTISTKLLQANKEWVYRNNDVIAMEVSKINFELFQMGIKDGEIVFTEIQSHPLLDLLDRPNPETTKSDAIYIIQSHKKLTGDAFWLKIRSNGQTISLRSLPPDKIKLKLRDPTPSDPTVIQWYEYHDVIDGQKVDVIYKPEDIIHFKKPNPSNYFRGLGSVEPLAETIDVDNLTNLTTKNFFRKGAITNFILTTETKVNDEQMRRIQADMKSMYTGAQNAYKIMVLGGGLKPEKLSFSNKDMEFLAQLAWYRDKIMVGFGNTLASLGMLDDVNRATHESSMVEWKRNTVKPDMDSIVNSLNELLVPEFGNNLILGYTDPIPEDRTEDVAEASDLYTAGIVTRNEARAILDYDEVEDGDEFVSNGQPVVPDDPSEVIDDELPDNEEEGKSMKRRRFTLKERSASEVPRSIRHIEGYKAVMRRRGVYLKLRHNKELKEAMKTMIAKIIKEHRKKGKQISIDKALELAMEKKSDDTYTPPVHSTLSPETIMDYYGKQMHTVDVVEALFDETVVKFLQYVNSKVFDKLETEVAGKKSKKPPKTKDVFSDNETDFMAKAQLDFTPLLENLGIIAGQEAYKLIGIDDPYLPTRSLKSLISTNVEKFTKSMLDTDRDHIINIITEGIDQGQSVVDIRNSLTSDAELEYTKNQATRVSRTEVVRASQQSALDAWKQSGVVEGKQWITAGASDECSAYEGKIETLSSKFYSDSSAFLDGDPPLHPNCRCSLIPIVVDTRQ